MTADDLRSLVQHRFIEAGLSPRQVEVRAFPGELIAIVEVAADYERALEVAQRLDAEIDGGFVTVRRYVAPLVDKKLGVIASVQDQRIAALIELLSSRERASETQPSLRYITDAEERISLAVAPRHHLVFGRRGVGKTALLLEAKRVVSQQGAYTLWVNMHPLRSLRADQAFLNVAGRLCDIGLAAAMHSRGAQVALVETRRLIEEATFAEEVGWPTPTYVGTETATSTVATVHRIEPGNIRFPGRHPLSRSKRGAKTLGSLTWRQSGQSHVAQGGRDSSSDSLVHSESGDRPSDWTRRFHHQSRRDLRATCAGARVPLECTSWLCGRMWSNARAPISR